MILLSSLACIVAVSCIFPLSVIVEDVVKIGEVWSIVISEKFRSLRLRLKCSNASSGLQHFEIRLLVVLYQSVYS